MKQYEVFYRETFIGLLTVDNATGHHSYVPDQDGVSKVEDRVFLIHEMREGTSGFVEPIPFFQNRLRNMERFGLRQINYQTDFFLIREKA